MTWVRVSQVLNTYRVRGAVKSTRACKDRYKQLKKEYLDPIQKLLKVSGFGWNGVLHRVEADDGVWERYLAVPVSCERYIHHSTLPSVINISLS